MIEERPTIMVSGGFDPVHIGHIRMIRAASTYGDFKKKGFVFMPFEQREEILSAVKGVVLVDSVDDSDDTVCEAIARLKPDFFANGGDRKEGNTPEVDLCEKLGIQLLWGVGGQEKVESSSELVERAREFDSKTAARLKNTTGTLER